MENRNQSKRKPAMNNPVPHRFPGLNKSRTIPISFAETTTFVLAIHGSHTAANQPLSARGEAAKPTSAAVAQQNHLLAHRVEAARPKNTKHKSMTQNTSVIGQVRFLKNLVAICA